MTPVEIAYIAGFFDGEGSVYITSYTPKGGKNPQYILVACIANTDPSVLIWIKNNFKGSIHYTNPKKEKNRCIAKWTVAANMAVDFLETIRPYIQMKRIQIDTGINFHKNKSKILTDKEILWRNEQKKILQQLKKVNHILPDKNEEVRPIIKELGPIYFEKPIPPRGLQKDVHTVETMYGKEKCRNFTLRLSLEMRLKLQEIANREHVTVTYLIRLSIAKTIKEYDEKQKTIFDNSFLEKST